MIETPYLLFLGDAPDRLAAKVAQGIVGATESTVKGDLGALENAAHCGKQTHVGDPESGINADY